MIVCVLPQLRCRRAITQNAVGNIPVKPGQQVQLYPPSVLMHPALAEQLTVWRRHSLMSMLQLGPSYLQQGLHVTCA